MASILKEGQKSKKEKKMQEKQSRDDQTKEDQANDEKTQETLNIDSKKYTEEL